MFVKSALYIKRNLISIRSNAIPERTWKLKKNVSESKTSLGVWFWMELYSSWQVSRPKNSLENNALKETNPKKSSFRIIVPRRSNQIDNLSTLLKNRNSEENDSLKSRFWTRITFIQPNFVSIFTKRVRLCIKVYRFRQYLNQFVKQWGVNWEKKSHSDGNVLPIFTA